MMLSTWFITEIWKIVLIRNDGFDEDAEREKIESQVEKDFEINYHILHKDFDRFQLRDHLIDIAGLYSHASDKKLFDKLSELLEFS